MMGAQDYGAAAAALTGTGAGTGAGSIESYMSPYQQSVIDATLSEYDIQAQKGQHGIMDAASRIGALGAGRTGVQLGEYQAGSDRNRAAIQAGLLQQGYTQGQGARPTTQLRQPLSIAYLRFALNYKPGVRCSGSRPKAIRPQFSRNRSPSIR